MRTSAVFFASVLGLGALLPVACTQDFGIFDPQGTSTGSSGTGGSSTSSTSSSPTSSTSSGTGGALDCMPGDACSDMNPCTADSCDQGKCLHTAVADGPAMGAPNTAKDCLVAACVGGVLKDIPDDADVPDDGNVCTKDVCANGVPSNPFEDTTIGCGANLFCDGAGACIGCNNANQCADPGTCKFPTCEGGQCKSNNTTSGKSCGGAMICDGAGSCVECVDNGACTGTKICINNACSTSCTTGVKDGTETDVDCGGLCMTNCALGKGCKSGNDCISGVCTALKCAAPGPNCFDGTTNGGESDVDCGGPCVLKCAIGDTCGSGTDCATATCSNNKCVVAPTCTDGTKNGAETDTDCGGGTCGVCGNGKMCVASTDCLSVSCVANLCAGTQCSDGNKNGMETATDCGGPTCSKCPLTKACSVDTDCLSNNCMASVCAP